MKNNAKFSKFEDYKARSDLILDRVLPSLGQSPELLHQAMRYSTLNAGKRLRPLLVYTCGYILGAPLEVLDYPAAAIELVHAFSLIHDDLPALDDDVWRRGALTCHKKFNESTAILAGDALFALAFEVLAQTPHLDAKTILEMSRFLANTVGSTGLIGGEFLDIQAEGKNQDRDHLLQISEWKTAKLIQSAVVLGALCVLPLGHNSLAYLKEYGRCIGIAYQIQDDISEIEDRHSVSDANTISDIRHQKATLPLRENLAYSQEIKNQFYDKAQKILDHINLADSDLSSLSAKIIRKDLAVS